MFVVARSLERARALAWQPAQPAGRDSGTALFSIVDLKYDAHVDAIELFFENPIAVIPPEAGAYVHAFRKPVSGPGQVMLFDVGRDLCGWLIEEGLPGLVVDPGAPDELRLTIDQLRALHELDRTECAELLATTLVVPRNRITGAPFGTAKRGGFVVVFRDLITYAQWEAPDEDEIDKRQGREFFSQLLETDLRGVVIDADAVTERWISREGIVSMLRG